MQYVYDIILNFNKELLDFYEWENEDKLTHIKKIPIFKIKKEAMNDILCNIIKIDELFLQGIYLKTETNDGSGKYLSLVTDSRTIIALAFDDEGAEIARSFLLIEDEIDVLSITDRLKEIDINYKLIHIQQNNLDLLTRKERKINKFIIQELKSLYKAKDYNQIKYYYYEYFNKQIDSIEECYKQLLKNVNEIFNEQNMKIYDIIKLSYQNSN
ncbi:MAG TPA: DUF3603 family protein [Bacilli bacterium]|nr:DUF3603 family protein [Bacilli bacterium]